MNNEIGSKGLSLSRAGLAGGKLRFKEPERLVAVLLGVPFESEASHQRGLPRALRPATPPKNVTSRMRAAIKAN